jgi:integrase
VAVTVYASENGPGGDMSSRQPAPQRRHRAEVGGTIKDADLGSHAFLVRLGAPDTDDEAVVTELNVFDIEGYQLGPPERPRPAHEEQGSVPAAGQIVWEPSHDPAELVEKDGSDLARSHTLGPAYPPHHEAYLLIACGRNGTGQPVGAVDGRQAALDSGDLVVRAAWWLLLARGPRRGEVCGLRWEDLDLEAGRLRIVHTRVMVDNKAVPSDPKTSAGRRSISLDPQLVAEFRSHRKRQLEERLRAGGAWTDSGFVFTDPLGHPIHPDTFSGRFDALIAKAGVRRVRLHDGRHSAATMLLEGGTPVHTVSQILGHSKASITLDVYAHAVDRGGEVAGERLTALQAQHAKD